MDATEQMEREFYESDARAALIYEAALDALSRTFLGWASEHVLAHALQYRLGCEVGHWEVSAQMAEAEHWGVVAKITHSPRYMRNYYLADRTYARRRTMTERNTDNEASYEWNLSS